MSRRLRRGKKEIERLGGMVHLSPELPDEIAELFLKEVLDCPECRAAAGLSRDAAGTERGKYRRGH